MTVPLATVCRFLRARGVNPVWVLDGAPWVQRATGQSGWSSEPLQFAWCEVTDIDLYVGADDICPAALGWAAQVLAAARRLDPDDLYLVGAKPSWIELWLWGQDAATHAWRWDTRTAADDHDNTWLTSPPPATPAARLAAVLRHELRRPL